jgi:hypothetical protein
MVNASKIRVWDLTSAPLRIPERSVPPELKIVLDVTAGAPWGKLEGRIVNAAKRDGEILVAMGGGTRPQVIPATAIVLAHAAFSEFWLAPLNAEGSFEFPRILPGAYEVRVLPDTPVTPAISLTVPASADLKVDITAPKVIAVPCPAC